MSRGPPAEGADPEPDPPDEEEVAELIDDLEEVAETLEAGQGRRRVRRTIRTLNRFMAGRIFGLDDLAQQAVGGLLLAAPFVVTEEVWSLAASMNAIQWFVTVIMVLVIGYGTLYRAENRDADREEKVGGLPVRFVSLVIVSYGSVALLAVVLDAPDTFGASLVTTVKAVCIGAIFSVVGAATADSLF